MKANIRLSLAGIFLLFALAVVGCQHQTSTPTPLIVGAINQFDQSSYQGLMAAQGALQAFKKQYGSLPAAQQAIVKGPLNVAIKDYNQAEGAWQSYHSNGATTPAAVSAALSVILADLANVQTVIQNTAGVK